MRQAAAALLACLACLFCFPAYAADDPGPTWDQVYPQYRAAIADPLAALQVDLRTPLHAMMVARGIASSNRSEGEARYQLAIAQLMIDAAQCADGHVWNDVGTIIRQQSPGPFQESPSYGAFRNALRRVAQSAAGSPSPWWLCSKYAPSGSQASLAWRSKVTPAMAIKEAREAAGDFTERGDCSMASTPAIDADREQLFYVAYCPKGQRLRDYDFRTGKLVGDFALPRGSSHMLGVSLTGAPRMMWNEETGTEGGPTRFSPDLSVYEYASSGKTAQPVAIATNVVDVGNGLGGEGCSVVSNKSRGRVLDILIFDDARSSFAETPSDGAFPVFWDDGHKAFVLQKGAAFTKNDPLPVFSRMDCQGRLSAVGDVEQAKLRSMYTDQIYPAGLPVSARRHAAAVGHSANDKTLEPTVHADKYELTNGRIVNDLVVFNSRDGSYTTVRTPTWFQRAAVRDDGRIAAVIDDMSIYLLDVEKQVVIRRLPMVHRTGGIVQFSPDGRELVVIDGRITRFDLCALAEICR